LPPSNQVQSSPYDPDVRYGKKRATSWVGYKLHVTETCAAATPHRIVHVATTPACVADAADLAPIHQRLADGDLLPTPHLVDAGSSDAEVLSASQTRFGVEVLGPTRGNCRWQARQQTGFAGQHFTVDWEAQHVICPQGHISSSWTPMQDRRHVHTRDMITVACSAHDCRPCPSRAQGTRAVHRVLTLHPREQEQALRAARLREQTEAFTLAYAQRAGVEGTPSQAARVCGLRRSRYLGQPNTHLQHILSAVALNLLRINAWLTGIPLAPTRQSSFARLMAQAA
jgi:transposase